jgi:hypothetical protein
MVLFRFQTDLLKLFEIMNSLLLYWSSPTYSFYLYISLLNVWFSIKMHLQLGRPCCGRPVERGMLSSSLDASSNAWLYLRLCPCAGTAKIFRVLWHQKSRPSIGKKNVMTNESPNFRLNTGQYWKLLTN